MKDIHKTPRLYIEQDLNPQAPVTLTGGQAHYLKSVLRSQTGTQTRLFNGRDGEWLGVIETLGKKAGTLTLEKQLIGQPAAPAPLHLLFAPIKKNRMDFLIEKAVELGVSNLHPVITAHTDVRTLKMQRIEAQIIESAEQCERLDLPKLHKPESLDKKIASWDSRVKLLWAAERLDQATKLAETSAPQAFIIGPEGGFNEKECALLQSCAFIEPISLGTQILRAETACLYCLSHARLCTEN